MNKGTWIFRLLGILTIVVALLQVLLVALNRGVAAHGGHDLKPLLIPSAVFLVIGVGLLLRNKLAAAIFIVLNVAFALVIRQCLNHDAADGHMKA
jgi:hypothetical protein